RADAGDRGERGRADPARARAPDRFAHPGRPGGGRRRREPPGQSVPCGHRDRAAGLVPGVRRGRREGTVMTEDAAAVRREVLGDEHVDRSAAVASEFSAPWQEFVTDHAWGAVWTRPGLDRRTRSMLTLALLAGLGHQHELA